MSEFKYCPKCVAKNEQAARFCLNCGLNFDEMPSKVADEKLEQNEDLAKLRAGVSLAKQGMQATKIITS